MEIIQYPNEILSTPCDPVTEFDEELHKLIDGMRHAMAESNGMGLSANQVGSNKRIFIMQSRDAVIEFINPVITDRTGNTLLDEGCLSAPGVSLQIPRAEQVTVRAQKRSGEEFYGICFGIEAVCVQHEIDHLDGIFFLEKVPRQQRRAALKRLGL